MPQTSDKAVANGSGNSKPVERLYPFARRARVVLDGRPALRANVRRLHFVLVAEDVSEAVRAAVEEEFGHVPIVQRHEAKQLAEQLGISGGRIVGFLKSPLARSIYGELKDHRVAAPSRRLESRRRARVRAAHPGDPSAKKTAAKKATKKATKKAAKKAAKNATAAEKPSRKQRAMARAAKAGKATKKASKKAAKKSSKKAAKRGAKPGAAVNKPVRRKPIKKRKLARLAAKRAKAAQGNSSAGDG